MATVKSWTQCRFKQKNSETVAWIDTTAAKRGNLVELLTLDGKFWEIISVGITRDKNPSNDYRTFNNNI